MSFKLYHGDCIKMMQTLDDNCVDMVLVDPPYGTTRAKWDCVIPFIQMWEQINRIIKSSSPVVIFATQPFTSTLILSNLNSFKYCWIWYKYKPSGHLNAKHRPMQITEDIVVFGKKRVSYYPQMIKRDKPVLIGRGKDSKLYGEQLETTSKTMYTHRFPTNMIGCKKISNFPGRHPTQKPISLMEYFIKTYTKKGDTVLDFAMGNGSTGIACKNLQRNFVGIELNQTYFEIAKRRITEIK